MSHDLLITIGALVFIGCIIVGCLWFEGKEKRDEKRFNKQYEKKDKK